MAECYAVSGSTICDRRNSVVKELFTRVDGNKINLNDHDTMLLLKWGGVS